MSGKAKVIPLDKRGGIQEAEVISEKEARQVQKEKLLQQATDLGRQVQDLLQDDPELAAQLAQRFMRQLTTEVNIASRLQKQSNEIKFATKSLAFEQELEARSAALDRAIAAADTEKRKLQQMQRALSARLLDRDLWDANLALWSQAISMIRLEQGTSGQCGASSKSPHIILPCPPDIRQQTGNTAFVCAICGKTHPNLSAFGSYSLRFGLLSADQIEDLRLESGIGTRNFDPQAFGNCLFEIATRIVQK